MHISGHLLWEEECLDGQARQIYRVSIGGWNRDRNVNEDGFEDNLRDLVDLREGGGE